MKLVPTFDVARLALGCHHLIEAPKRTWVFADPSTCPTKNPPVEDGCRGACVIMQVPAYRTRGLGNLTWARH